MANNTGKNNKNKPNKFTDKGSRKQGRQVDTIGTPYRNQNRANRRNTTKSERQAMEAANTDALLSRDNPVSYYTKYDTFVSDAANLPFAQPLGAVNNISEIITHTTVAAQAVVPGVMRIEFAPTIGVSKDFTSPINRSSIRFYTYLRSNQKASATYDHQDITMMEIALDSCYMFHGLMSKIYAIVNQFTPANEYYSRATIAACGADFNDIRANLQDFRAYINAYAYSLGQYALPSNITLFDRHRWMVEGMYTDSTSTRAQTYLFVPIGFWQYDNTVASGSQCKFLRYLNRAGADTAYTFKQLKMFGDTLLNAISNEEDFAVISGDIYNFYGGDTYSLPYIDENYSVLPVYNETVLSQIENLTIPGRITDDSMIITQNPNVNSGAILFQPKLVEVSTSSDTVYMNFHHDRPTSEDVIEASRLMATADLDEDGNLEITACGTEVVQGLTIFTRVGSSSLFSRLHMASNMYNELATNAVNCVTLMSKLAQFDWAPQLRVWAGDNSSGSYVWTYVGSTWDIDNYDVIPNAYLFNIHLGCLLSLFKAGNNRES